MATKVNEILQFASQDTGSNLLTQSEYDGDAQRVIGHQPGIARSRLENKVLRQCSTMAAGLAEFVLQNQDGSVTDSMSPQEIASALTSAVGGIGGMNIRSLNATATLYSTGEPTCQIRNPYMQFVEIIGNGLSLVVGAVRYTIYTARKYTTGQIADTRTNIMLDGKTPVTEIIPLGIGGGVNTNAIDWYGVYPDKSATEAGETFAIQASGKLLIDRASGSELATVRAFVFYYQ